MACGANAWIDDEVAGCRFADERLGQRLRKLLDQMAGALGESIPLACQDWANTKAAYRFFANERISDGDILGGHFQATRSRVTAIAEPILVLHDTTEFSYQRKRADRVGLTCRVNSGKDKSGRFRMHTVCGLLMHASLAVTTDGLPLGLAAVKFWTRKRFKGTAALKRRINPTRIPIECKESVRWLENMRQSTALFGDPGRCVHIGDRESDIYELFCLAQELGTHFLVRCCVDRLAGDGTHTVSDAMAEVQVQGRHHVEVRNGHGALGTATVELSYHSLRVLPPIGKRKRYPELTLTVLHAQERDEPVDRPRIDWRLITDLPVHSNRAAIEKLRWYAHHAVEDRAVPQDPEVGLQSGGGAAENGGTAGQADRGLLHPELARLLDDDDQPLGAACRTGPRPDRHGDRAPRPLGPRQGARPTARQAARRLPDQDRQAGRLSRPRR